MTTVLTILAQIETLDWVMSELKHSVEAGQIIPPKTLENLATVKKQLQSLEVKTNYDY